MKQQLNQTISFDDVLIAPAYSDIDSRDEIDATIPFLGLDIFPIISANMDYITEFKMAHEMAEQGCLGVLHRFRPWSDQLTDIKLLDKAQNAVAFAVGVREPSESLRSIGEAVSATDSGLIVVVDVAHGHSKKVADLVKSIKNRFPTVSVIAGNVATADGAFFLADAGADAIKVGIGPGSVCTTRTVTGVGVPQLSAILQCADALKGTKTQLIADGGIRSSGDIVKALAAGADAVMLGHLLAGTDETPGELLEFGDKIYKRYRGQSIFGSNGERFTKEGVSGYVPIKGPVLNELKRLIGGIRSGMSYVGARNIQELREKAEFIQVTHASLAESNPRIVEVL